VKEKNLPFKAKRAARNDSQKRLFLLFTLEDEGNAGNSQTPKGKREKASRHFISKKATFGIQEEPARDRLELTYLGVGRGGGAGKVQLRKT